MPNSYEVLAIQCGGEDFIGRETHLPWALALPIGLAFLALVIGLASKLEERP